MEKRIEFYMTAGIAADMDADKHFAGAIGHIIHRFLTDDALANPKITTVLYASEY